MWYYSYVYRYAYVMAAAQCGVPHARLSSFMVSNVHDSGGEAWSWVDEAIADGHGDSFCTTDQRLSYAGPLPTWIHYCQGYDVLATATGDWQFHKGHVPANILDCHLPLFKDTPRGLFGCFLT